jgi:hypothetical protein
MPMLNIDYILVYVIIRQIRYVLLGDTSIQTFPTFPKFLNLSGNQLMCTIHKFNLYFLN